VALTWVMVVVAPLGFAVGVFAMVVDSSTHDPVTVVVMLPVQLVGEPVLEVVLDAPTVLDAPSRTYGYIAHAACVPLVRLAVTVIEPGALA
jgi:hypothetical protein